jgi:hypothetical protein
MLAKGLRELLVNRKSSVDKNQYIIEVCVFFGYPRFVMMCEYIYELVTDYFQKCLLLQRGQNNINRVAYHILYSRIHPLDIEILTGKLLGFHCFMVNGFLNLDVLLRA